MHFFAWYWYSSLLVTACFGLPDDFTVESEGHVLQQRNADSLIGLPETSESYGERAWPDVGAVLEMTDGPINLDVETPYVEDISKSPRSRSLPIISRSYKRYVYRHRAVPNLFRKSGEGLGEIKDDRWTSEKDPTLGVGTQDRSATLQSLFGRQAPFHVRGGIPEGPPVDIHDPLPRYDEEYRKRYFTKLFRRGM